MNSHLSRKRGPSPPGKSPASWPCFWIALFALACLPAAPGQVSNTPASNHPAVLSETVSPALLPDPIVTRSNNVINAESTTIPGTDAAPEKAAEPDFQTRLEMARHQRLARQFPEATTTCVAILEGQTSEKAQRGALTELALIAQAQNNLPRAQQIYGQCLARWPRDASVPEFLLRQGMIYRQMGLPNLAVTKFYAVMASALMLKADRMGYYEQLVLLAQNEIAQTQYDMGDYAGAAPAFGRLLKLDTAPSNRPALQYRYVRCLAALGRPAEAIVQAQDFLERYPAAPERPEVRFLCATSMKQAGRNTEAARQVLDLLREQHTNALPDPQTLAYWQRRAGNEIGNRFYVEGDSMRALDIYLCLAGLDNSPEWQLPVRYQIGLVFERLHQPEKAVEYYESILQRDKEIPTNAPPSLKTVLEMAHWRKEFVEWQSKTETANLQLHGAEARSEKSSTNGYALQIPGQK